MKILSYFSVQKYDEDSVHKYMDVLENAYIFLCFFRLPAYGVYNNLEDEFETILKIGSF